jgi:GNAT superfamily N-acetyltransferase
MAQFHQAVKAVFNFDDSMEVYRIVQRAPSYIPELDLILLSDGGEVAAFCTAWLDNDSGVAELEPVGAVPDYRRKGLASALIAETSNRLRGLGCKKVTVNSWSESLAANRLYQVAGLQAKAKITAWERRS